MSLLYHDVQVRVLCLTILSACESVIHKGANFQVPHMIIAWNSGRAWDRRGAACWAVPCVRRRSNTHRAPVSLIQWRTVLYIAIAVPRVSQLAPIVTFLTILLISHNLADIMSDKLIVLWKIISQRNIR